MIDVRGFRKTYGDRVVRQLDHWKVPSGGHCCITGPSGSGRSTPLEVLCALRPATAGRVEVAAAEVTALAGREADGWRGRTVGVVTQMPHRLDVLTAYRPGGRWRTP